MKPVMEKYLTKIQPYVSLNMKLTECTDTSASMSIHLDRNRNDKNSMFAGSIYSAMVLCGSTLARYICDKRADDYDVVIKESTNVFVKPVHSDCVARASLIARPVRKKNNDLSMNINIELLDENSRKCAELSGTYIGIIKNT